MFTATPLDLCWFLVWKDKGGKTQVHLSSCPHLGLHGVKSCACPVHLSYKSVDSFIGKLRAIFKSAGCDGNWDVALGLGNPAASLEVQRYLKAFTSEQLQAITPQQAILLFVHKLLLSRHIHRRMTTPGVSALALFTFVRDDAFFKTLFFSGDRHMTLMPSRPKRSFGFRVMTVSYLTMFGGKHSAMGLRIFLAYAAIGILLFARSRLLKLTWLSARTGSLPWFPFPSDHTARCHPEQAALFLHYASAPVPVLEGSVSRCRRNPPQF